MPVTPSSLKWLITKHARLNGELQDLNKFPERLKTFQRSIQSLLLHFEELQACLHWVEEAYVMRKQKLEDDIRAVEAVLNIHEIRIDPAIIPEIGFRSPKKLIGSVIPYGAATRGIYEFMRLNPDPVTTADIALFIAYKYSLTLNADQMWQLKEIIRKRMKTLCTQKKVIRLHPQKGREQGSWVLP